MRMQKKSRSGIAFLLAVSLAAGMVSPDVIISRAGEIVPVQGSGAEVTSGDARDGGTSEVPMADWEMPEGTEGNPVADWEMPAGTAGNFAAGWEQPAGTAEAASYGEPVQEGRVTASGDFSYVERADGTLEVTRYLGNDSVIVIPDQVEGKKVVSLGLTFSKCRPLRAVVVGANISEISPAAFSDNISLKYFAVDSRNPYFTAKDGILYRKDMKELICCPLGKEGNVEVPKGVTSIGKNAFSGCHLVAGVTLPEGLVSIGEAAFGNCISLSEITVPGSVAELGNAVFSGCTDLKKAELAAGNLKGIVSSAFSGSGLERISIPEGVTSIGDSAFQSCGNLQEITLPEGLASIGANAFFECSSLAGITIPKSVAEIGGQAFLGCSSLLGIEVDGENQNFSSEQGLLYNKDQTEFLCCPAGKDGEVSLAGSVKKIADGACYGCTGVTGAALPEGLETVGGYAFFGCSGLKRITVPETVTGIGSNVFQGCSGLERAEFRGGVEGIPSYAFDGCGSMAELVLPETLKTIGLCAFQGCSSLAGLTLPASVTGIDGMAFDGCRDLASIAVAAENEAFASVDGALYSKNMAELVCCPPNHPGGGQGVFTVPEGVSALKKHAFQGSRNIKKVELPQTLSMLENWEDVFSYCTSLEEIAVAEGNTVFSSENGVLYDSGKTRLVCWPGAKPAEGVVLPETVETIWFAAFKGSNISSIALPGHVKSIGPNAFTDCGNLTEITLAQGLENIGEYAFSGCRSLAGITLPKSLSLVGPETFRGCTGLEGIQAEEGNPQYASVQGILYNGDQTELLLCPEGKSGELEVPERTARISFSAFSGCGKLGKMQVPESVLFIKNAAFSGCSPELALRAGKASYAEDYAKYYKMKLETVGEHETHDNKVLLEEGVTCTTGGKKVSVCAACGQVTEETAPPAGHTEVEDPAVPGTCLEPGKTAGSHCSACGQVLKAQRDTYGSHKPVREPSFQASCTKPGKSMGVYCSVCGKIMIQPKDRPALGHDSQTLFTRATARKDGKILVQCKRPSCKAVESETIIYAATDISLSKTSYTYNGKVKKPSVTVKDSKGNLLKEKQDYTVSYASGRKNVGIYTVTVKLQGNYVGNVKKTFRIVPKGTSITKLTSRKKGFLVKWKKQAAQAAGYEIAYSTDSKFKKKATKTVTIKKNKTVSRTVKKLKAKKKYYVRIRTFKTVKSGGNSQKIYSAWSKAKTVRTK